MLLSWLAPILTRTPLGLLLAATTTAITASAQWPQFRGPTGDGHATARNVPLKWSSSENVAWKTAVPGRGWSSPVLADGKLFLTSAVGPTEGPLELAAMAFDAGTGKLLWSTSVFTNESTKTGIHRKNSHASPTPIVADHRVFVHFGHLGTAALDTAGKVLWRQTGLGYNPVHGNGGSPILHGKSLIYLADGSDAPFLAALNLDTGDVAWKVARKTDFPQKFSFATPSVFDLNGAPVLIAPASGFIAAHDARDGHELWRVRHEGWSVIPKPVFAHGLIFAGTGYETATTIAIRPGGSGDVTDTHLAWSLRRGAPNTPSFLAVGEELYLLADSGVLSCVDARTGTAHYQERACGQSSASPIFAEGRIYLLDEQGLGVVVEPGRTFKKLAENPLGERTLASYAVADGALFIRSEEHLFRIGH
ncbi:MAG: PQQ-binding-like beta-propeller repeat protein [Verrucomicrobiales bacterium]|nr:PQQ-binding-like beta-propeller repeat protein [Verrucomicrobiales bacterium]